MSVPRRPVRRRDRHGRGLRGPLLPVRLPGFRKRSDRFDDVVRDALQLLERRWANELADVEVAVEDVPGEPTTTQRLVADETPGGRVPLARVVPAGPGPARLVLFRRPLELRAEDRADLGDLVLEVLVDAVAELLGLDPDDVDPR